MIQHPILGIIKDAYKQREWTTDPLPIGAFGYISPIIVWTDDREPNEAQLDAMVQIAKVSPQFKALVGQRMLEEYIQHIRPAYFATIGDSRYRQNITVMELPEMGPGSDIWQVITGIFSVIIDEKADLSLAFSTTFDRGHEFAVRFKNGGFYEVMMDG